MFSRNSLYVEWERIEIIHVSKMWGRTVLHYALRPMDDKEIRRNFVRVASVDHPLIVDP